jgi:pycsar effector protein
MPRKPKASLEDQKEFLKGAIESADRLKNGVENKASIVLGANSILLAALGLLLRSPFEPGSTVQSLHPAATLLLLILVLAIALSILCTLMVLTHITPQRRRALMKLHDNEFNVFFAGAISRYANAKAYREAVETLGTADLVQQLYGEAYNLSCIVIERYKWFQRSLMFLIVSLFLLLTFLATAMYVK